MRITKALIGLAFASSLVACGPETRTYTMTAQNSSGEAGTAVLTELESGGTRVEINLSTGSDTGAQKAHIHNATCANINGSSVLYPLNDVVNGKSTTDVTNLSFEEVKESGKGKWAINVHNSQDPSVYVSCGDFK